MNRPSPDYFRRPTLCPCCAGHPMIASNKHGYPPIDPNQSGDTMLDLPEFYLKLMFDEPLGGPTVSHPEDKPEQLVA